MNMNVMIDWFFRFVHHLTEDMKQLLSRANIKLPLLSHHRHNCEESNESLAKDKICDAYQQQVTCADCHSDFWSLYFIFVYRNCKMIFYWCFLYEIYFLEWWKIGFLILINHCTFHFYNWFDSVFTSLCHLMQNIGAWFWVQL